MKRKFSTREKILLVFLAVLLIGCFYYLLVDQPVRDMQISAASRQAEAQSTLTVKKARVTMMRQMQNELQQASAGAEADVPDYDNARQVVQELNNALAGATSYNLSFRAVEFDGAIACRTIDMTFTCNGYYKAKDILNALRDCPYRCEITSLSMESGDFSGGAGNVLSGELAAKVTVTFYEFAAQKGSAPAAD